MFLAVSTLLLLFAFVRFESLLSWDRNRFPKHSLVKGAVSCVDRSRQEALAGPSSIGKRVLQGTDFFARTKAKRTSMFIPKNHLRINTGLRFGKVFYYIVRAYS